VVTKRKADSDYGATAQAYDDLRAARAELTLMRDQLRGGELLKLEDARQDVWAAQNAYRHQMLRGFAAAAVHELPPLWRAGDAAGIRAFTAGRIEAALREARALLERWT
jgi:hypothetical protein